MATATDDKLVRPRFDKDHPFVAPRVESVRLSRLGSAKDTWHLVFDLAGSGLTYHAGDSLGIWPVNSPETVADVLTALGVTGDELVPDPATPGATAPLRDLLGTGRTITLASTRLVELLAATATNGAEATDLRAMLSSGIPEGLQVLDLLTAYPSARPPPPAFVAALGQLRPRLYSMASSPAAHGDLVHLTIEAVRYVNTTGRPCEGVASTFAVDRLCAGDTARVYVHHAPKFGLPPDPAADLIMVGPGTGVAPFRAFLFERRATAATGRNWLLFGAQHRATDFLYEDEMQAFLADGTLARLDLAFSRDQAGKIYVQHRLRENAEQAWAWLSGGAHFRVCGDARMGRDVEATLKQVLTWHGHMDPPAADAYVKQMLKDGRYQRDVY